MVTLVCHTHLLVKTYMVYNQQYSYRVSLITVLQEQAKRMNYELHQIYIQLDYKLGLVKMTRHMLTSRLL